MNVFGAEAFKKYSTHVQSNARCHIFEISVQSVRENQSTKYSWKIYVQSVLRKIKVQSVRGKSKYKLFDENHCKKCSEKIEGQSIQ